MNTAVLDHSKAYSPDTGTWAQIRETMPRLEETLRAVRPFLTEQSHVAEIGPGYLGRMCQGRIGCEVVAYDKGNAFKKLYARYGIPYDYLDLHNALPLRAKTDHFDVILLCEVIEHVARWPINILTELRGWLKPGGLLMLTTPNLTRTTNRIRLLLGRRLFAPFQPEHLLMAHVREYTLPEIRYLMEQAGYETRAEYRTFPDVLKPKITQAAYTLWCRLFPTHSNIIFAWGTNPE